MCMHMFNSTSAPPISFVVSTESKYKKYQMAITECLFSVLDKQDRPYYCEGVGLNTLFWIWVIAGYLEVNTKL